MVISGSSVVVTRVVGMVGGASFQAFRLVSGREEHGWISFASVLYKFARRKILENSMPLKKNKDK